jgi:hypothetical protein
LKNRLAADVVLILAQYGEFFPFSSWLKYHKQSLNDSLLGIKVKALQEDGHASHINKWCDKAGFNARNGTSEWTAFYHSF